MMLRKGVTTGFVNNLPEFDLPAFRTNPGVSTLGAEGNSGHLQDNSDKRNGVAIKKHDSYKLKCELTTAKTHDLFPYSYYIVLLTC